MSGKSFSERSILLFFRRKFFLLLTAILLTAAYPAAAENRGSGTASETEDERILLDFTPKPAENVPDISFLPKAQDVWTAAFSAVAENIKPSPDGESVQVDLRLDWPESAAVDGKTAEAELFRLTFDADNSWFFDSGGKIWYAASGGKVDLRLPEKERTKRFSLKLIRGPASENKPASENQPASGNPSEKINGRRMENNQQAGENNGEKPLPVLTNAEIHLSALLGWMPHDWTFFDIFAPRLNETGPDGDRMEYGETAVTLHSAERLPESVRAVVSVEYASAYDFFDSHEERLASRPVWLKRRIRAKNDAALSPIRRRPQKMSENGETAELIFPLSRSLSGSDQWNLILNLPLCLTEENFTKRLPIPPASSKNHSAE